MTGTEFHRPLYASGEASADTRALVDHSRFLTIRDEPRSALLLIVAACLWIYYLRLNRRLTGTGL